MYMLFSSDFTFLTIFNRIYIFRTCLTLSLSLSSSSSSQKYVCVYVFVCEGDVSQTCCWTHEHTFRADGNPTLWEFGQQHVLIRMKIWDKRVIQSLAHNPAEDLRCTEIHRPDPRNPLLSAKHQSGSRYPDHQS